MATIYRSNKANHTIGKFHFINHILVLASQEEEDDLNQYIDKTPGCGIIRQELTTADVEALRASQQAGKQQAVSQGTLTFASPVAPGQQKDASGVDADLLMLGAQLAQQAAQQAPEVTKASLLNK